MILCGVLAGCETRVAEGREPVPEPPYQRTAEGTLRVRRDLLGQLRFARAERSELRATLQGFGRVAFEPGASYAVRVPVAAYVERVFVTAGQRVERGAALATLRSQEVVRLRGEAQRARVALAAAREELARVERLVPQGAASERERVAARAEVATHTAELTGVTGALAAIGATTGAGDTFTLRASAAGQVVLRTVDPGERVEPDATEPAFLIGDPEALEVRAAFPEREAPMLRAGERCVVTVRALGEARIEGEVTRVVQALDRETHTATAVCRPTVRDARLQAEMVARVEIDARGAAAVLIPRGALLLHRESRVVFVQRASGELERREVEVGAQPGDRVQVLRGVEAGETVVSENAVLLDGELDREL